MKVDTILKKEETHYETTVKGWVRSFRNNRFVALNDGSCLANLQIVIPDDLVGEEERKQISEGAAIEVAGEIIPSQGKGQRMEMNAAIFKITGNCPPNQYPLQLKNRPSLEYLREIAHLRFRTNTFGAVFRIRHSLAYAIHHYFNKNGFYYLHTPIITASDAEGAGEMFQVTNLDMANPPKDDKDSIDYSKDFFGQKANLTVSGQLEAELGAMALGNVYTFGPTFRAENSNTSRHLAEFWMIEPEMAFCDLKGDADLAEDFIKYLVLYTLEHNKEDLKFLAQRQENEERQKPKNKRSAMGLIEKLELLVDKDFERITYTEAIDILQHSKPYKKHKFKFDVSWGIDLQSEHERYLVEKHFKKPVIVTDYPKGIKAFYMRLNDDSKTVAAMDVLAPGIGEIVGGSQREERLDVLKQRMAEAKVSEEEMNWYLDIRKFGTAPHSGFGLGFERMMLFVTGMANIRDVIPFPRTPQNISF